MRHLASRRPACTHLVELQGSVFVPHGESARRAVSCSRDYAGSCRGSSMSLLSGSVLSPCAKLAPALGRPCELRLASPDRQEPQDLEPSEHDRASAGPSSSLEARPANLSARGERERTGRPPMRRSPVAKHDLWRLHVLTCWYGCSATRLYVHACTVCRRQRCSMTGRVVPSERPFLPAARVRSTGR